MNVTKASICLFFFRLSSDCVYCYLHTLYTRIQCGYINISKTTKKEIVETSSPKDCFPLSICQVWNDFYPDRFSIAIC